MFYPQRVVDVNDGKPKWTGLDEKSELMDNEVIGREKKRKVDEAE